MDCNVEWGNAPTKHNLQDHGFKQSASNQLTDRTRLWDAIRPLRFGWSGASALPLPPHVGLCVLADSKFILLFLNLLATIITVAVTYTCPIVNMFCVGAEFMAHPKGMDCPL